MSLNEKICENLDKIKLLREELKTKRQSLYSELELCFEDIMKEYRSALVQPATISWTQSTPGFNDGDPCAFTVYVEIKEGDVIGYRTRSDLAKEIEKFINENEDFLEYHYGDGFEITIDEDGINIEKYYDY